MCARAHMRVPQAGRAREGRGRRSHRARTDVVLTALRGDAQGRAGRQLPSRAHSVTAFTNDNKNSYNTHRHQSGHSHSALDSEAPLLGAGRVGGSGRMRYLCRPKGQLADKFQLWTGLGMQGGEQSRGRFINASLTVPWVPGLPISLCFSIVITLGRVKLAPRRTRVVVVVAAGAGRQQAWKVGALWGGMGFPPGGL